MIPVPTKRLVALLAVPLAITIGGFWVAYLRVAGGFVTAFIFVTAASQYIALAAGGVPDIAIWAPTGVSITQRFTITLEVVDKGRISKTLETRLTVPESWQLIQELGPERVVPGRPQKFLFTFRPLRRGTFSLNMLHIRSTIRGSLVSAIRRIPIQKSVDVFPDVQGLNETLFLLQRDRLNHLGVHASRLAGTGNEVAGLREYAPDDDARWIDWKVSTRIQSPVVRTYQHESGGWCTMLVDCGRSMSGEEHDISSLDHAVNSMLILAGVMARTGDYLQIAGFHEKVEYHMPPVRGRGVTGQVARFTAQLQPTLVESNYRLACEYALRICRRSSLVIMFTDLMDATRSQELIEWFARLQVRHFPILVMLRDKELYTEANRSLDEVEDEYLSAAAREMVMERGKAIALIRSHQIPVIDVLPSELTPPLIGLYIRSRSKQNLRMIG